MGIGGAEFIDKELEILDILDGSYRPEGSKKTKICDVVWNIIKIEVKAGENDKKITLNQIRACKYLVLIGIVTNKPYYDCDFLVYPPDVIIERALSRRGQATYNALASFNMGAQKYDVRDFGCSAKELPEKVVAAYEQGERNHLMKNRAMNSIMYEEFKPIAAIQIHKRLIKGEFGVDVDIEDEIHRLAKRMVDYRKERNV